MIYLHEFEIPKKDLEVSSDSTWLRETSKKMGAGDIGMTICKDFPYEESDISREGFETWVNRIFATSQKKWTDFKKEIEVVMNADHMSNEQKIQAINHLLIFVEKN